ncbi:MAG TPA: glutathione-disulfide reductase [Hyphomonadaceae bacterium]|nr:glutathione-disulfide reductase [Hyphomonadaceae bacterium]
MPQHTYDLFVIGAGSGGVRAARLAAKTGARVATAEEYRIGGTCVIRGCVPKKLLVYASEFGQAFKDAAGFGWSVENARFDWPTLRDNVQAEVTRLSGLYRKNLDAAGVTIFKDRAVVTGPHAVRVEKTGETISAARILIATGGQPYRPYELRGQELAITSNEAFHLERLPQSIVVAGGGYIAVEFASIFSGLGVETNLLYRGEKILRGFDEDLRDHVQSELARTGVNIVTGAVFNEIAAFPDGRRRASLSNGASIEAEQIMFAIGREPSTGGLGLENAGVTLAKNGAVAVDAYSRTNIASIFAVGDVTDRVNLTPVAIREAVAFVQSEFLDNPMAFDHADVASAVFGRPPVACVGLTEADARAKGRVRIYRSVFRPMKNILAGNEQRTLMKLVVDAESDRVIGVHLAGPEAPELIQLAAIAVKAGLTKAQWDATCAVHPTAAEELVLMGEPVSHDNEAPA